MESNLDKFKQMDRGFDLVQAIAEADRCLLCHDAPCSAACPAQTDPGTFIRKLRLRNITGAIRVSLGIASNMAERVVNGLEPVDVDMQQCQA